MLISFACLLSFIKRVILKIIDSKTINLEWGSLKTIGLKMITLWFIRLACSQTSEFTIHIYERYICHDLYRPTCGSANSRCYSTINLCTGTTKLDAADYTTRLATLRGQASAYTPAWGFGYDPALPICNHYWETSQASDVHNHMDDVYSKNFCLRKNGKRNRKPRRTKT